MSENAATPSPTKNSRKMLWMVIGIVLLMVLFFVFAWGLQKRESTQLQGSPAPEFSITSFEGQEYSLSSLNGTPIVVNFWASWCVECYKEAALLEQAYQDYQGDVMFLGIDYLDTEKDAMEYMQKYGVTYPSGPDIKSQMAQDYRITGVPETFFITADGQIIHVHIGPIERPQLYQLLETLTNGGTS